MPEGRKAASREHRAAVTRMLKATGLLRIPEEAPLVALVKSLAKEMDEGGGSRTYSAYLSALKDVRRVLDRAPGSAALPSTAAPSPADADEVSSEEKAPVDQEVLDFAGFAAAKGRPPRRQGA
ncbi:hypothetical protein GCM10009706_14160 [Curtobacterium citreum]|nr:hypothetical protein FB462_2096 [Curtobacterium citreum]GGL76880.1 hypothetical protein GCM10009706_14160 [Curtobacterium citreum]